MEGLSTYTKTPSLSESYGECILSFQRFLLALSEKDSCVIRLEQVHPPEILEEYGRTKIWGDQTKADLPSRARGSLDDTLRHDDELRHLVEAILVRLRALLVQATSIAKRKYDPAVASDRDSISSVSANSDSDLDDDSEYQNQRMPKIRLFVQQMQEQIQSLYDLSSLLRRPKIADKYIRSINSKSNTATLGDSDAPPLSVGFSISDESHIAEKVLQWRGLTKSGRRVEFENEDVAPVGQALTSDVVEDILWFCHRLARANTRRREQLQYWNDHPYDPKQDAINVARLATLDVTKVPVKQEQQESRSQASTLKPPDPNFSREGPKSALSKQSFSTAAVSDIYDTKTNVRPRTVYAPTAIGQGRSNSVPDPPKMANETDTFPCPYCGMTLESNEMQNRQSWKRHVFRDLRPYVCTFEDCQNAGKLYATRHDWIHHELQIHRRKYVCNECHEIYFNRNEMLIHLREHYGESVAPARLGIVLDLCNRQVDVSDNKKDSCLVCAEELSLSALQGHLATHMEDIALFVLPNIDEEEVTGESDASVHVVKLKSKGKTSDTESEASSLGFSVAGSHGQTPAEFAEILTSEEAGYASKFSSWTTTDEDQNSAPIMQAQTSSEEDGLASKGDLGKAPGLAELMTRYGVPPMPMLSPPMAATEATEDDDDDDDEAFTMDLKIRSDPIIPTYDGFRAHIRQLNPRLADYMVERMTQEQMRRYRRLLEFKTKHLNAVKNRNCSSGKFCTDLCSESQQLPSWTENTDTDATPFVGSQITAPGSFDDEGEPEGTIISAQFPSGVPLPPVKCLPAEFECPLCFKVKKFYKPSDWTKHIYEDIMPFACTFPNCGEPKIFKRKADWVRHENERHRQLEYWTCSIADCNHTVYREDNFIKHLVREHKLAEPPKRAVEGANEDPPGNMDGDDIWSLVSLCRRDTTKQPKDEPCRFCGTILPSWKKLTVHLAKHMEQISMPILLLMQRHAESLNPNRSPVDHPLRYNPNFTLAPGIDPFSGQRPPPDAYQPPPQIIPYKNQPQTQESKGK